MQRKKQQSKQTKTKKNSERKTPEKIKKKTCLRKNVAELSSLNTVLL